jgi:hypothetical protein
MMDPEKTRQSGIFQQRIQEVPPESYFLCSKSDTSSTPLVYVGREKKEALESVEQGLCLLFNRRKHKTQKSQMNCYPFPSRLPALLFCQRLNVKVNTLMLLHAKNTQVSIAMSKPVSKASFLFTL